MYSAAALHIDYPMLFELHNVATERVSHCGVLEFIAEEGMIYMPYWVGTTKNIFLVYAHNIFFYAAFSGRKVCLIIISSICR